MRQIAKLAGVSLSTVSHALRDDPVISLPTRERIQEIAGKLNYRRPESRAPDFSNGLVIGYLIHEWFGEIATDILRGATEEACRCKFGILLYQVRQDRQWIEASILNLLKMGIRGLVLAHSFTRPLPRRMLLTIRSQGIHVVQIMHKLFVDPLDSVCRDERAYARVAAEHFAARNHRHVVGIQMMPDTVWEEEFHAQGMDITLLHDIYGAELMESAFHTMMQMRPRPTAVITVSEAVALRMQSIAREHGVSVPGDLSIIGIGNHVNSYLYPDITTIDIQPIEMGRAGIRLLADRIASGIPPHEITDFKDIVLPARVIPCNSTGPVAVQAPAVRG